MKLIDEARKLYARVLGTQPESLEATTRPRKIALSAGKQPDTSMEKSTPSEDIEAAHKSVCPPETSSTSQSSSLAQSFEKIISRTGHGTVEPQPSLASLPQSESTSAWRKRWFSQLIGQLAGLSAAVLPGDTSVEEIRKTTYILVANIFQSLNKLVADFNGLVAAPQRLTTTAPYDPAEQSSSKSGGHVVDLKHAASYIRCRASTSLLSLSVRGKDGVVEFFIVPVNELVNLSNAESSSRLKLQLLLDQTSAEPMWTLDGFPVDTGELNVLVRNLFKDLILGSSKDTEFELDTLALSPDLSGERLRKAILQLVMEKQNLVQKIVTQQEEIQNNIARDLHDAVIADVMMLKRSLSGDKPLSDTQVVKVLDQIAQHLREICHDLSPRDLKDWGLQTVIEDLLQRVSERTSADCVLNCDSELPDIPNAVQLHIYRIVQECLNNIEKYAEATRVTVTIDVADNTFTLTIQDNGKGFNPTDMSQRRAKEGGSGMGSIRERAELIRCFYPARLFVESQQNEGSKVMLEIKLAGTFPS
ncbi:MAG: sensor histidine kinase [Candidatus Melainabacteria bacterium]|nr:sensor histidine kinase [Candidatus Melainabacteria bacterium]